MSESESEAKARLLRALAFHIRKKISAADALTTCFEAEGKGGRHRKWREAGVVLADAGFVPALTAAGLIGAEAAVVLTVVEAANDHRLLARALDDLAVYGEGH